MLGETIENVSILIGIDTDIIPNIITFMIVVILLALSLKGYLSLLTLSFLYAISMGVLSVLGIDSVFNIITLIENWVGI